MIDVAEWEISNFQTRKFKITSYYSRHYSNSAVTIQIRGTIQNIKYYSNSEYEQENPTHKVDEPLQGVSLYALFLKIITEYLATQRAECRFHATICSSILAIYIG